MEMFFLVIILSSFWPILSLRIELTNGVYKFYPYLYPSNDYQFYVAAEYGQTVEIEVRRNNSIIQSNYDGCAITYSEHLSDGSTKKDNLKYGLNKKDNVFTISRRIGYSLCDSLIFQLNPDNIFQIVYIRAIVTTLINENNIYNLTNATSLSVGYMNSDTFYKFYIPAQYDQIVSFKLTIGLSRDERSNMTFYEYITRKATFELRKEKKLFYYYSYMHYYESSFRVQDSQTQYVAFELKPSTYMKEVNIISYVISPIVFEYDLENDVYQSIRDLKYENTYKFYLPVKYGSTVEIILSDRENNAYQYKMTIYELFSRYSTSELRKKIIDLPYNSTRKYYVYLYNIYNRSTNYIVAELRPPAKVDASIKLYAIIPPDYENNIYSDITFHYKALSNPYRYKFYIPAVEKQTLDIVITSDEKFDIDISQEVTLYEYSSRTEKIELNKFNRKFDYLPYLNAFILSFDVGYYSVDPVKWVAFEILPFCNMTSVNLTATIKNQEGYVYDLTNNTELYFRNLIKSRKYKFYIYAKYTQSVELFLNKSDSTNIDYISIKAYEYSRRYDSAELSKKYIYFKSKIKNNSYKQLYLINNPSTTYVAFEMEVSYNYLLSVYLKAIVKYYDYEIDLIRGSSKFIESLLRQVTYKFYVPVKYHQRVSIEFTGYFPYSYSSQYINICEYSSRKISTVLRNTSHYLSTSYNDGEICKYYLSMYTINNPYTTYVAFEIAPNSEWDSIYVNSNVTSWASYEIDLTSGKSKKLEYLYYITRFYISARYNQTIKIKFTKKNSGSQMINIYEFQNRTSLDELRFIDCYLDYDSKKKYYTQSFTVRDYSTNFVAFEFVLDSYIKDVTVKASLDGDDNESESGGNTYTAVIIVSIIFVIAILAVIIFCYMKKYRRNDAIQNLTDKNTTQPLYPISQDIN